MSAIKDINCVPAGAEAHITQTLQQLTLQVAETPKDDSSSPVNIYLSIGELHKDHNLVRGIIIGMLVNSYTVANSSIIDSKLATKYKRIVKKLNLPDISTGTINVDGLASYLQAVPNFIETFNETIESTIAKIDERNFAMPLAYYFVGQERIANPEILVTALNRSLKSEDDSLHLRAHVGSPGAPIAFADGHPLQKTVRLINGHAINPVHFSDETYAELIAAGISVQDFDNYCMGTDKDQYGKDVQNNHRIAKHIFNNESLASALSFNQH